MNLADRDAIREVFDDPTRILRRSR